MIGIRSFANLLIVIVFLSNPLPSFAREKIDLPRAINYAIAQNRELVRSALAIDSNELGVSGAQAEFQVSVRPEASVDFSEGESAWGYGLHASKKLIWGTELSISGSKSRAPDDDYMHRGSIQLEIQQPIFRNFGTLVHREAITQANNDLKSAQRRFEMQKADLLVEVVKTYEAIRRLTHQVRSDQESFRRMDALYRVTEAKEVLGRTTRIDTLRVKYLRGQALSRLEANSERLSSTQRDFAELLGFFPETVFDLKPTPLLEFNVPQLEEAVRVALQNRLDYAIVIQNHEDALRGACIARKNLLPDLKLIAGHEWFGEGPRASDAERLDENVWFVGVSADTDFNLTKERVALGQARVNETSALKTIKIVELSIARQVQQHLLAHRRAQAELKITKQNFDLASGRAKLARRLFELGRGDNFSVTDAEEAYLQAENQRFSAQAEASISGYQLSRALGTLIEVSEKLKPKP